VLGRGRGAGATGERRGLPAVFIQPWYFVAVLGAW